MPISEVKRVLSEFNKFRVDPNDAGTNVRTALMDAINMVADDAAAPSYGFLIGLLARSAQKAAVAQNDLARAVSNLYGELVNAGYTWATQSNRAEEIDALDEHYLEEELVDTTNVGAATNYYPSSTGLAMGNYNQVTVHGRISGGVTFTFEAKIDDSTDWEDITRAGYRLDDNTTGNASLVDQNFIMAWDDLNVRHVRIASVTADATNGVQYHWKLRYM